jgi:hypothetical protein
MFFENTYLILISEIAILKKVLIILMHSYKMTLQVRLIMLGPFRNAYRTLGSWVATCTYTGVCVRRTLRDVK